MGTGNAAGSAGYVEVDLGVVAPCPQVVTSLYQIGNHNGTIFGESIGSPAALTMTLGLVKIKRYSNIRFRGVDDANDRGNPFW